MEYWHDAYRKEWLTKVIETTETTVTLEKSFFYATSGGQPQDHGIISYEDRSYQVISVSYISGSCVLDLGGEHHISVDGDVKCELDWNRRFQLMRMHTASHLMSSILEKHFDVQITGNQLGIEESRIDYNLEDYDPEVIKKLEQEFNDEIQNKHDVSSSIMSRTEAEESFAKLSKLQIGLPEHIQTVRIVKIGNIDIQACGGTHLNNTAEIGFIIVTKSKNKGKDNRRLYFKLK